MKKAYCDVCGNEIQPNEHGDIRVHHVKAYVQAENLTRFGFSEVDYCFHLETCKGCISKAKQMLRTLQEELKKGSMV